MPTSFSQVFGLSGSRVSILTATTSKSGPPSFCLQRVERRHFLAAGHAPGRPEIEQHGAAAPVGQRAPACRRRPGRRGPARCSGLLADVKRRHFARAPTARFAGPGRPPAGRPASAARIALQGRRSRIPPQARRRRRRRRRARITASAPLGVACAVAWIGSVIGGETSVDAPRRVMSNKMWGGRFASGPDAIMEEINASIDFDRHLYRQDIAASKAHAAMLAKQGIITADDADKIAHGLDTILSEIEAGKFTFKRALEDIHMNVESRLRRTDRRRPPGGCTPRARATTRWRPISGSGCATPSTRIDARARRLSARAGREGAGACRHRDAGLHPSADRAAGDLRPSPARLCRDGGARPRPLRRCAQAAQRIAARRGGARRHVVSDRPRHDREGARLRPARRPIRSTRSPTATSCWRRSPRRRSRPCICRASPRRS